MHLNHYRALAQQTREMCLKSAHIEIHECKVIWIAKLEYEIRTLTRCAQVTVKFSLIFIKKSINVAQNHSIKEDNKLFVITMQ